MSTKSKKRSGPAYRRQPVVGFVCEGSTDIVVLRAVTEAILGPIDPRALRPLVDEMDRQQAGTRTGWSEVRAWCQSTADFADLFLPDIGDPLDLLVIAIDLDIAIDAGVEKEPENLSTYDAKSLCDIIKSWLPAPLPGAVVIAIPVTAIEAWILAALFPKQRHPEFVKEPAASLVQKGKMEMGRNGPWKRVAEYKEFAALVAAKLKRVRAACGEADRFSKKVERVRRNIAA